MCVRPLLLAVLDLTVNFHTTKKNPKKNKTRGRSSEESSPLPDEKKRKERLPPFSKVVSQQSNDLHPLPVFSVFTLHVCPLSPYKALCDEPV